MNTDKINDTQQLLNRVRTSLSKVTVTEKRMFGGITLMLNGNMLCCASKKGLMIRVGAEAEAKALHLPHARPCDGTGHKMPGFIMISPEGIRQDSDLDTCLKFALDFVGALPAKLPKAKATRPNLVTHQ